MIFIIFFISISQCLNFEECSEIATCEFNVEIIEKLAELENQIQNQQFQLNQQEAEIDQLKASNSELKDRSDLQVRFLNVSYYFKYLKWEVFNYIFQHIKMFNNIEST